MHKFLELNSGQLQMVCKTITDTLSVFRERATTINIPTSTPLGHT